MKTLLYNIINIKSCIVIKKHTCSGKVDLMLFFYEKVVITNKNEHNTILPKYFVAKIPSSPFIVFNNLLKLIITHQNSKQALVRRKTTLMPWNTKTKTAIVWIKDEITIIIHLHLLIT